MPAKNKPAARRGKLKFPPGYLDRARRTIAVTGEANRAPAPGPLLEAFTPEEAEAFGLKLQPVVAWHWLALQKLESPLLKNFLEHAKLAGERTVHPSTDEEVYEVIYLFTVPPPEARAALAAGRQAFRERATAHVADRLHTTQVLRIAGLVRARILDYWATGVSYGPRARDGEVFTMPPAARATG